MSIRLSLLLFLVTCCLFQCKNEKPSTPTTVAPTTTAAAPAVTRTPYPSISQEKMLYLYDNCDYVDFVFYATNFSMSQNQQPAIRATLSGISTAPAEALSTCSPVGRVFFQVDGKNEAEADLFFGGDCLYYLWFEEGQYKYGNRLSESGFNFYKQIFESVTTQKAQ